MSRRLNPPLTTLILGVVALAASGLGAGCADEAFEPRRETMGRYTVVWIKGTPYELG